MCTETRAGVLGVRRSCGSRQEEGCGGSCCRQPNLCWSLRLCLQAVGCTCACAALLALPATGLLATLSSRAVCGWHSQHTSKAVSQGDGVAAVGLYRTAMAALTAAAAPQAAALFTTLAAQLVVDRVEAGQSLELLIARAVASAVCIMQYVGQ